MVIKTHPTVSTLIQQVETNRIKDNLFHLAKDPIPYRKANYTIPGHTKSTLDETDEFLTDNLESAGYQLKRQICKVQAFRCDQTKPIHHWYSAPQIDDPWYSVHNLYVQKTGETLPDEIVLVVSHKDSPSWVDSPGAYDNAVGTIANLEIARLLHDIPTQRSIWFLWCNEEHTPWTSISFAQSAQRRGDNFKAIFNLDSLGGKSKLDFAAGIMTNVTRYSKPEGEKLADLMAEVNQSYGIGLQQFSFAWDEIGDDDGSFINAGYPAAVMNLGSFPYADPNYHLEEDIPEYVDIQNVAMTTQASLAAILHTAGLEDHP